MSQSTPPNVNDDSESNQDLNLTSPATRSHQDKVEDPPPQSPTTFKASIRIGLWNENKRILVIIAVICFGIFLLLVGVSHRFATANPSTNVSSDVPGAEIHHTNGVSGLGRLEKFVSHGAINGSFIQDRDRQVHPGTRERVLTQIKAWIDNPNATEHILWLHGPAGVGKSTIAQTITYSYTTEKVPANFFFFHSDSDRNNGNRLFTTLAWQFTSSIPAIKRHIARSLIDKPDLPKKDVETQFEELIVLPFEALSNVTRLPQLSSMVVVIDGVDECQDAGLQERILNVIGNVATDIRVPLRFFIISRPEDHIEKTIDRFKHHTLSIDLAEYADADGDIQKYLKDKFNDIAKDQDIGPALWPGEEIIQKLVYNASGQFIYASTVIRFVGDEDNSAEAQLNIILGLQSTTTQPFAALDELYTEILKRQSDQNFLKTFLGLLLPTSTSWTSRGEPFSFFHVRYTCEFLPFSCCYRHLRPGYGIRMNMSEQMLRRKLRKMRSLLKFTPPYGIYHHHKSFLEFLCDPSRSGQYSIITEGAMKQQLVFAIASVARAAEQAIDQSNYYPPIPDGAQSLDIVNPRYIDVLSKDDLREASRPLLKYQDRLLKLPNIVPPNECTVFHVANRLLSVFDFESYDSSRREKNAITDLELVNDLMITLLSVKPEVVAMKVHSWSEAQNLMDLTYFVVNGKYLPTSLRGEDETRKAVQLAFEIHTRVPVLPRFITEGDYWLEYVSSPYFVLVKCLPCEPGAFSQALLISKFLDHRYILALSRMDVHGHGIGGETHYIKAEFDVDPRVPLNSINDWRKSTDPSYKEMMFVMLNLARTIQYLHSMGFVLSDRIRLDDIHVDWGFHVRISPTKLVWSGHGYSLQEVGQRSETGIYTFGSVFCMIYFGTSESSCTTSQATRTSLYKPESGVPGDVGQLIQQCLSAEGKPTIDEVVQEMESWKIRQDLYGLSGTFRPPFSTVTTRLNSKWMSCD